MTPERWLRLQDLFHGAALLDPPERDAYLDAACAGDSELRQEAEALLSSRHDAEDLAGDIDRAAAAMLEGPRLVGTHLGPYRLVKELGRGGMGRVFLAYRDDDQFQRRVAVKVADAAPAGDLSSRFRSERQILAALDHPNIARLLDGGTTAEGLPYLVLEYVEGEPIDRYCDLRQLGVPERLRLFRVVCSAVHYAHQNLVVHRDLKPSNVLVTGEGTPKLLDFGIAKLLNPELLAQAPALTTALHRPMTPDYASPEQVRGETVTTASDVYSLGVLLYELLTGCRPLRLQGQTLALERIVSEVEPEPPSRAALRPAETTGPTPEERARAHGTTPERLRRQLEGDLDNIVMMALRKAPARRYASAEQLAEDVRRAGDGLPVRARKDTLRYRMGKFVRRHRYPVGVAALFLALIVGFGVNRAQLAGALADERDQARQEAETARRVASFLEDVFRLADPTEVHTGSVTAREILDRAAERLAQRGDERPEVRAELLDTMGEVYRHLGLYARAEPFLQDALAERRQTLGDDNLATARSLLHLGEMRDEQARYAEAEPLLRAALRVREQRLSPDHLDVAEVRHALGTVLRREGQAAEAETMLRGALALRERALGDAVPVALSLERLAEVLEDKGELQEALALARRAVDITRRRLGEHVDTALCLDRLGSLLRRQGDFAAAEGPIREALAIRRRQLGPSHPALASGLDNLANLLRDRGELAAAEPAYREALAIDVALFGDDHFDVASIRADLAELLLRRGRLDEAEELFTQSLEARSRSSPDSSFAFDAREGLARVAAARGDLARAETMFRQVLDARRQSGLGLPASSTLLGLGQVLARRGDAIGGEPLLRQALALRLAVLPPHHWQVAEARAALAACLAAERRAAEGEPLPREAPTSRR
jgi:serine/threonine-protein kinase